MSVGVVLLSRPTLWIPAYAGMTVTHHSPSGLRIKSAMTGRGAYGCKCLLWRPRLAVLSMSMAMPMMAIKNTQEYGTDAPPASGDSGVGDSNEGAGVGD